MEVKRTDKVTSLDIHLLLRKELDFFSHRRKFCGEFKFFVLFLSVCPGFQVVVFLSSLCSVLLLTLLPKVVLLLHSSVTGILVWCTTVVRFSTVFNCYSVWLTGVWMKIPKINNIYCLWLQTKIQACGLTEEVKWYCDYYSYYETNK